LSRGQNVDMVKVGVPRKELDECRSKVAILFNE